MSIKYLNPDGLHKNPAFSQVVVTRAMRTLSISVVRTLLTHLVKLLEKMISGAKLNKFLRILRSHFPQQRRG